MTVSLRDARTNPRDLEWIESVYRDYLDDLGLLNTGIFPALGEIGHREPDQLQRWLVDRSATLLTILDDQQPAGFAMVARQTHASRGSGLPHGGVLRGRAVRAAEDWDAAPCD